MTYRKRWLWMGFVVVFALLLTSGVAAVQEQEDDAWSEAVRVAESFDAKYLLSDYIAYSGIEATANYALAVYNAASFDAKFFDTQYIAYSGVREIAQREDIVSFDAKYLLSDYIAYGGMQEIAQHALDVYHAGVMDRILRAEELAQEQFGQVLAVEAERDERVTVAECFDIKYTLEGSIYCNDQAQVVEEEVDPS